MSLTSSWWNAGTPPIGGADGVAGVEIPTGSLGRSAGGGN